jgi:hypothetical protein
MAGRQSPKAGRAKRVMPAPFDSSCRPMPAHNHSTNRNTTMTNSVTIDGVSFTDDDVLSPDDFDFRNYDMFIFHDHGFVLAVCFADSISEAFDILADSGKIDHLELTGDEADEYADDEYQVLGSNGKFYDVDTVSVIVKDAPKLSIVKLLS